MENPGQFCVEINTADLKPWLPYRRLLLDNEHRNTVIFEALALAQVILRGPTPVLVKIEE